MQLTPAPGTPYAERRKQLDVMSFQDVRLLATESYRNPDGSPLCEKVETVAQNSRTVVKQKVLSFELANGMILPDGTENVAVPQQNMNGDQQMNAPFNPNGPMQQPMPQGAPQAAPMPMPGQMPTMPGMPGMPGMPPPPPNFQPMQGAPMGMPSPAPGVPMQPPQQQPMMQQPMAQPGPMMNNPGMPQGMPPPGAAPMPATPQQAAEAAAPATGKKRGRGSAGASGTAAAPPPAPAQAMQQPMQQNPVMQQPVPMQPGPVGMPQAAPMQVPMGMPQQQPMAAPMQQPHTNGAQAGGLDSQLGQIAARIDTLGKVVTDSFPIVGKQVDEVKAQVAELKSGINVLLEAVRHIYLGQAHLGQIMQGKSLNSLPEFVQFINTYLPR